MDRDIDFMLKECFNVSKEETENVRKRIHMWIRDNSCVHNGVKMNKMLKKYFNVSKQEMEKIRIVYHIGEAETSDLLIESYVRVIHTCREIEKKHGINLWLNKYLNVEKVKIIRESIIRQIEATGLEVFIRHERKNNAEIQDIINSMLKSYFDVSIEEREMIEIKIPEFIHKTEMLDLLLESYIRDIHNGIKMEKMLKKYFTVSKEEMEKIRRRCNMFVGKIVTSDDFVEGYIRRIHYGRTMEKQLGSPSLQTQPLAHIISLTVEPYPKKVGNKQQQQQLALYGTIYAHYLDAYKRPVAHQIYERGADVPDILGTDGSLTLHGPDHECYPEYAYLPLLQSSRVDVNLFDQTNSVFARRSFSLDDNIDDNYEKVKSIVLHCKQGFLTLHYMVIPFGINCLVDIQIPVTEDVERHEIVNVNGTIVARYADTYGKYSSQECVLFKKQDTEFEPVDNHSGFLKLSRCWLSSPAYSSLIIEVDLSEFGSGRKIANGTKKLLPEHLFISGESPFLDDDMDILICESWHSPQPFGRNDYECSTSLPPIPTMNVEGQNLEQEIEEIDTDGVDESSDDDDDDDDDDGDDDEICSWYIRSHKDKPTSSTAVEIFSVLIGQEKSKAVQIYGSIEVLRNDKELCYIFKRDENEALGLSENLNSIPISDGSRVFDACSSLKMKFDIKDIESCLAIKGYVDWETWNFNSPELFEKQLCSLIRGQHGGFAAIHYSIFDEAVRVTIKVLLNLKTGSFDVNPKVWGSLVTQYSHYDYSSRYNKDYYRSVLFKRTRDDLVPISNDSTIPLSRSTIIVPSYSSLIVNVDLSFGVLDQELSCDKSCHVIKIGEGLKTVDTNDYVLHIKLDWCKVK